MAWKAVDDALDGAVGGALGAASAAVVADRLGSIGRFGTSVLSGLAETISDVAGDRDGRVSRTIGPVTQPLSPRPGDRPSVPRRTATSSPRPGRCRPDPASVLTVVDRLGSLQFDPLDIAGRNHDLVLLARIAGYRRAWTDAHLYGTRTLYETYNKGLSHRADRGDAVVPHHLGPAPRVDHDGGRVRRARPARRGAARPDPARRAARRRPTSSRAPPSTGTGGRPTRSARSSRRSPRPGSSGCRGATATAASTTSSSGSSRPTSWPRRRPRDEQRRHKLLSRYRAHGLLGDRRPGGDLPRHRARPPEPAARRAELVEAGTLDPGRGRGRPRARGSSSPTTSAGSRRRAASSRPGRRPGGVGAGRRLPGAARPAGLGPRAAARACGTSTTSGRCTSPRRSGAGATTSCRSCSAIGIVGRIEPRFDRKAGTLRVLGRLVAGRLRPDGRGRPRAGLRRGDRRRSHGSAG